MSEPYRKIVAESDRRTTRLWLLVGLLAASPTLGCAPYAWSAHRLAMAGLPEIPSLPTYGGVPAVPKGSYGRHSAWAGAPGLATTTSHSVVVEPGGPTCDCGLHQPYLLSQPEAAEVAPWPRFHPVPTRPIFRPPPSGRVGVDRNGADCEPSADPAPAPAEAF